VSADNPSSKPPQGASQPARIYQLKPYSQPVRPAAINAGPGRSGPPGPPATALIYQKSNSGIEPSATEEKIEAETRLAVSGMIEKLPVHHRKKMYRIRRDVEWLAQKYGVERVGMLTLTIRENVTDGKEFSRRFKSISTNVFNRLFHDWVRVFERQKRGAWHVHVVVATKDDIRTGTDVVALNDLLKKKRDRRISKSAYYAGIQRLASVNLRTIWKVFRTLCAVGDSRRKGKRKLRRYQFDAAHMLPIISSAHALATYVSKYISKGFQNRRKEDKGLRLMGCSKRVSKVCSERFSWAEGAGRVWRGKLADLAAMLDFKSPDDFAKALGCRWAYHIRQVVDLMVLPHYPTMKEARADGWDLVSVADGSPWPWPDLDLPKAQVQASRTAAFRAMQELILRRRGRPKRKSRVETGWDPERWEAMPKEPRQYRYFKPPAKPRAMRQEEFIGLEPPRRMKD
jgi:hypothetical protein